ncbi:hypothetical protein Ahy_B05g078808 [Arachis hypogaea]|uniref:Aminotransferase-like plant mobile domain-containing protein n=1 Tax=Arachis hypogaea TaxID=3818 RepID=A0A444Z892_ARAHY|nr:hypothetical protein Ahy_B05g078808 [Arachis hypogaea]
MAEARSLYRLNGVVHVAGSINEESTRCIYLERAGLYHLARLNARWFWLDEPLVSAFIERWRLETYTFHMPFGECTITLQDVAYKLRLPVDGLPVSRCLTNFEKFMEEGRPVWEWFEELFGELPPQNKVKQYTVHFTWFHERFRVLPADATDETVCIYARAYIMMLLSTQLFGDKSGNRVHIWWLSFVVRLDDMGSYSWGSAAFAWLYRCMCRVANRNMMNLAGPLQLLQSWIFWRFPSLRPWGWATYLPSSDRKEERVIQLRLALDRLGNRDEPYASLNVIAVVHPEILTEEHSRLWRACTCLIYFTIIEWHQVDRVLPHLGGVQHEPEPASNIDWFHAKDGRGGDRWFPSYYQVWHLSWQNRFDAVLTIPRVSDPGPSADFLRVALRFLLPDSMIADPRADEISQDVSQRGSSQAPPRVPMPDVPDNRRVERRRRVGTRATDQEWRWLDDMIQDDRSGGDEVGHADHCVRRGRPQPADTQEVPLTHVSSSQVYHDIHGQMYDDLAGPTFTMDMEHEVGSSQFYSDFADLIRDDGPPDFQQQTPQDQVPETQPQMDVAPEYLPDMDYMQRYQPQMSDPHGFQHQLHVDLNEPTSSLYDSWLGMGGTPASAYDVGMPVDPPAQQRNRPTRVRRAARCGTWSHLLSAFGHDSADEDQDRQGP